MKTKTKNINSILSNLLDQYNLSHIYSMEIIKNGWPEMDKTIAAHSEPIEYNPRIKALKVKINNKTWKKEFIENREVLLSKVKNFFKNIEIKSIEFI